MLPQAGQVFATLLEQKHAPKGDLQTDFKTAVYLCAATKHYTFEEILSQRKLDILSFMLASVGFKGSTSNITIENYLDTIQELLDDGALEYIGEGAGFVASESKLVAQGEVSCARSSVMASWKGYSNSELRFTDEAGKVYPLFSKFVTIPGDKVKVVINTFLDAAYVVGFVKMRASLMGDVPENSQKIFFREKGFSAYDIRVTKDDSVFKHGSLVVAEILARKSPNILIVRAREVKGDRGMLDNFIIKAILEHGINSSWPETVKKSVKNIPQTVSKDELKGRVDLRQVPLVTIDGEDARDFDDAVYCKKEGDKFHLYVAIADVSYYVRTGSAIDAEALERTTSVYFPYFVVPMLPEELSNGICSLNPNVDRLCMVCDMIISQKGKIESYDFYPAVMRSHARLTYTEAHSMITENKALYPEHEECIPWVQDLHELYLALKRARDQRGVFEFESTEVHFLFNDKWEVKGMEPEVRNEAHMLIEECMIAANICAATFVRENKYQSLYRVHQRPTPEKLDRLRTILSRYGIDLPNGYEPTPVDFKKVSDQVSKLSEGVHQVIALQLLRSMSKAIYSPDNEGHFGLALENYSHFTSPIRRYPDLQIHRVIKYILEKKQKREWGKIGSQQYNHESLVKLGVSCTEHEISAADAEFDVDNSLKCEYVKNFINDVVDGTVSAIGKNGVYITLNDFYIDGMMKDVYIINKGDSKGFSVSNNQTFFEGDQIKVRIAAVNSQLRFIDLLPVLNPRKKDERFDIQSAKDFLKSQASDDLPKGNEVKTKFLDSIGQFSRGIEANNNNTVTRAHLDYSVESALDIPNNNELAAPEAIEIPVKSAAPAKKATKTKASPKTKAATTKAKSEVNNTAPTPSAGDAGTTVITVKRKSASKGAQKTTVIALDSGKPKSVKKDDIDPLLIDTASRIDADLGATSEPKSTKSRAKSNKDTKAAAPKSTSKASKSNAKAKQEVDVLVQPSSMVKEDLTDNLTLAKEVKLAKPKIKATATKAKATKEEPKAEEAPKAAATKKAPAKKAAAPKATKAKVAEPVVAKEEPKVEEAPKAAATKKAPAKKAAAPKAAKAKAAEPVVAKEEPKAEEAPKATATKKAPAKKAAAPKAAKAAKAVEPVVAKEEPKAEEAPKAAAIKKAPAKKAAAPKAVKAKAAEPAVAKEEPKAKAAPKATATKKDPAKKAAAPKASKVAEPAVAKEEPKAKEAPKATATKKAPAKKAAAKKTSADK